MFTIDQIKKAHEKVKSGADFPAFFFELMRMGVSGYDTYVSDGHSVYYSESDFAVTSDAKYSLLTIADQSDKHAFEHYLKIHQQGQTDYFTFCGHSAETGIEKWQLNMKELTCTYFDKKGEVILSESIPSPQTPNLSL